MNYESSVWVESKAAPGVAFRIGRMSFGRRIELTRKVRELAQRIEFLEAGERPAEKIESALVAAEIDMLYLDWGLLEVRGLDVDGAAARPKTLVALGPEELAREAIAAVKAECGLSEDERKN